MKLQIMSDLHFEMHADGGAELIRELDPTGVDVLVLAGDIVMARHYADLESVFKPLAKKYHHILYVPGNHEYYKSSPTDVARNLAKLTKAMPEVVIPENKNVVIAGQRFIAGTMWFRPDPAAEPNKRFMHDFSLIQGFEPWVYEQSSFIWAGFDYIGEPTPYSSWPSKSSYYGAIDTAGFPKDVYYFYKSRWTTAPMVHVLPQWNWSSGTNVTVFVYTNCDSVELFLNNTSQGSKAMTSTTLRLEWSVPWASGTLRADCKVGTGGTIAATDQVRTAGAAAKVALSADRTSIRADGKDLIFVTGDIQDANGAIVPNADNSVSFAVTGPGRLVGVDNGNPIDTSSYKGTSRKAFSGKVLAIVQSTGTAGQITVNATSSGLTMGTVSVAAQ